MKGLSTETLSYNIKSHPLTININKYLTTKFKWSWWWKQLFQTTTYWIKKLVNEWVNWNKLRNWLKNRDYEYEIIMISK